jgi:CDP-glucose 4,6-dehydratase
MRNNFWKDRRVLVTGHTGFKGGWLACVLSMAGAKFYGFSNDVKPSPSAYDVWAQYYKTPGSEFMGDITDITALRKCMDEVQPEIVFHLAAQSLVLKSYEDPLETVRTNILGTANVLECCRFQKSLKTVIIVTTDKVYKIAERQKAFSEADELGGKDLYSSSKACCELLTESYRHSFFSGSGVAVCTVRAGNVIGGGDWSENRLIPDLIRAYEAGGECLIRNSGSVRPWQHVLEPLHGYMVLAEKAAAMEKLGGAWNFGPGADSVHDVKDVVERVASILDGLEVRYEGKPENAERETGYLAIDSAKAREQLGWSPRLSFEETIGETCRWYLAETDAERKEITEQQITNFGKL